MCPTLMAKVIEPMLFRGSGEFDPEVRGIHTIAMTRLLPLPSTFAGALASYLIDVSQTTPVAVNDWESSVVNTISRVLGVSVDDMYFRGPYLKVGNNLFIDFLDTLVEVDFLAEYVSRAGLNFDHQYIKEQGISRASLMYHRFGVHLSREAQRNPTKLVKEGYLYTVSLVDFSKIAGANTAHVCFDTYIPLDKLAFFTKSASHIVRFGGEGRISSLSLDQSSFLLDKLFSWWKDVKCKSAAMMLISPSLMELKESSIIPFKASGSNGQGKYYYWPSLTPYISKIQAMLCDALHVNVEIQRCFLQIGLIGAGYSLAHKFRRRKPVYPSLMPGSYLFIRSKSPLNWSLVKNLYWKGVSAVGSKIGYGSVILIPLLEEGSL